MADGGINLLDTSGCSGTHVVVLKALHTTVGEYDHDENKYTTGTDYYRDDDGDDTWGWNNWEAEPSGTSESYSELKVGGPFTPDSAAQPNKLEGVTDNRQPSKVVIFIERIS